MVDNALTQLAATVTPVGREGRYSFSFGDTVLEIDPTAGARVSSFRLGENELLTGPEVNPQNWGSTFWPSPQSAWGWPPPPELDSVEYPTRLVDNVLILSGPPVRDGAIAGLSITKRVSANAEQAVVMLEYEVTNRGLAPQAVAGWEITRVPRDNLHFFPEGAAKEVKKFQPLLPLRSEGGVAWLSYDPRQMPEDLLVGRDGAEGWLASLRGRMLFIKQFPEVAVDRWAPGEAEILLFLNGNDPYVELEAQSALVRLEPGASLGWGVRWYARRVPDDVPGAVGSRPLIDFVRATLVS